MLLTGTFRRALDAKQRIAVPKRLRGSFDATERAALFIAPGTDGSLALYTEEAFSELGSKLAATSPNGQDVRAFSRLFYSQAQRVELDGQGRFRIPEELCQLAGLAKEVILVGVGDRLEIWDPEQWVRYLSDKRKEYDTIAERAFMTE